MRSPLRYSAVLLLAACSGASRSAPEGATPVPAAAAVAKGAVRYRPGTTRFRAVSHAHQEQQIENNKQEGNYLLEYLVTTTLALDTGQQLRATFVLDSLRAEGGLVSAAELSRVKGSRLTGVLRADGQVAELSGDSLFPGQLQTVATAMRQFYPRVLPAGIEPGQQWSDTVETTTGGATRLTIRSTNDRRVTDWSQYAGIRALRIEVTAHYTLSGSGQQMGQEFTLIGSGRRLTTQYLSEDGRYLGSETRDSSSVTVSLPGMGMSFPSLQLRADTVSVVP